MRIGGAAAWLGAGAQRLRRHVACNIIVGQYCVSFGGLHSTKIAAARQEGEAELSELQADLGRRREEAAEHLMEIGAELAAMSEDRDAARQELERFIALRERVGIELVDFRGRTVVVVPEGSRLRRWRAAGLSEVAHLNGRMYRLSD
ncbi:hypothetical protein [Paracoccus sp. Ld10]|uniref:hypothetical protein n=1 Tax=Paracoccus sp. Ld10 TaxID=649158 RepID=UPI00387034C3